MSSPPGPVGTVEVALGHAARLLATDPAMAAEQATEILKVVPEQPQAMLLLGIARRKAGDLQAATEVLDALTTKQPNWAAAHYELGLTLGADRKGDAAVTALRRAVELKPDLGDAWRALGDHLTAIGDGQGADEAYARHIRFSSQNPRLLEAGAALCDNRIAVAEALLREHLKQFPTDVAAIRMLAEVAARLGRMVDSETLLTRCLELAPSFAPARHNLALVLHRQHKPQLALSEINQLLELEPKNPGYRNLKAAILSSIGEYDRSIEIYSEVLAEYPNHAKAWMSYGHALKTAGHQEESIQAYRKSIELKPGLGETYWSLANLKTFRFSPSDLDVMRAQLRRGDLTDEDRYHFHFAIGKALEDLALYAESFEHYANGNRLRRAEIRYDAAETSAHVQRSKAIFSKQFFAERAGMGAQAPDPIFIVGLPRAGSTLLEQILSSHPAVEGTMELPNIPAMAGSLGGRKSRAQESKYPEMLVDLSADELRALGEKYIAQTRIQRKTGAPFFIDKLPNNFAHVGLIHLILPNARIIDARRHPVGCCFSGFKQHFARGQHFTYSLEDLGAYYRDYVELMAHIDTVLPGRVHRVIYEQMIDDTESEVRRLLAYCGLPFDERCLRFYENERAVRTASSEQVRQPIFRDAVEHWRHFEPSLGPLKDALGPVLEAYPATPEF
jgi:tetratricopeptide (TPR) repeat protein